MASAGLASLISLPQLIGALGGASNALPLESVLSNLAIDLSALGLCGFLLQRDLQARDRQMARLTREEKLGKLSVQLANGKVLNLAALRGSARVVIAAGTKAQVRLALEAAAPLREELQRRGVFVVPLPIYPDEPGEQQAELPALTPEDLRWCATPLRLDAWSAWFASQLALAAKAKSDNGLFVGLRLDGRVRSSGQGIPPWRRYAAELAPLSGEGAWTGFMDGFDGRIRLD